MPACISCKNIQRALKSDYDVTLPSCVTNLYTKVGEHYKYSVILMPDTIIMHFNKNCMRQWEIGLLFLQEQDNRTHC